MSKRRRTDTLTGGTGDVKPQVLTLSTPNQTGTDRYISQQVILPVPRLGLSDKKASVLEILSLDYYLQLGDFTDTSSTGFAYLSSSQHRADGDGSTEVTMTADIANPRIMFPAVLGRSFLTSGMTGFELPIHVDCTDGNGNGIIIATDTIFITYGAFSSTIVSKAVCKMKYRLINVGVIEYVGLLQSQQAP